MSPPKVSFEFFPPKTDAAEAALWQVIGKLAPLNPAFVSVTYGAGGTTRAHTHGTVRRLRRETALEPAAHLTCVGAGPDEIAAIARDYWDHGIRHIVALRGDLPADGLQHPDALPHAVDLVRHLKRVADFEISVAAYPEGHPQATSLDADIDNLKAKIDAGAARAITQYFFDVPVFERWLERVRRAGITVPIVPGILPVTNFAQLVRFSAACGTTVPKWLADMFEGLDDDPETRRLVAATVAAEQAQALLALGLDTLHFYTLNRAELVFAICRRIGVKPVVADPALV